MRRREPFRGWFPNQLEGTAPHNEDSQISPPNAQANTNAHHGGLQTTRDIKKL